ncbi:MAG: diguanylate cyclase [Bryobacteraceae bacterium]|nr:diguanylate cyclase [Bryobacteraceae bacterium]
MGDSATIQLLETLSEHSVRWRDADFEEFKGSVEASLAKLRAGEEAGDLAGQVAKYQRETQQQIEASLAELHDMIRVLLSAIEQAQGNPEEAGAALDRVANTVQSARTAEELQTAREQLSKLLTEMAPGPPGAARPKSEGAAQPESKQMATDPATGLPGKDAAVAALESIEAEHREHSFLVMLYVQRMELVTARFGETFGGQVLFFCAQHIARLMHPEDQLFRWRGPAFVALLRRDVSLVEVRQEVLRACGSRIMFESANNSVLLPINMSVQVVHVDSTPVPELLSTVESFLTNPNARR